MIGRFKKKAYLRAHFKVYISDALLGYKHKLKIHNNINLTNSFYVAKH
jgi:hypothetical protein